MRLLHLMDDAFEIPEAALAIAQGHRVIIQGFRDRGIERTADLASGGFRGFATHMMEWQRVWASN